MDTKCKILTSWQLRRNVSMFESSKQHKEYFFSWLFILMYIFVQKKANAPRNLPNVCVKFIIKYFIVERQFFNAST